MFGNTLVQTRKTFVAMPPGSKTTVAAATTLLVLATAWLVYATGEVQFAFLHLMYVPVVLSALAFGVRGGVLAGIVGGLLLGPLMPLDTSTGVMQQPLNWIYRLAAFALIGALVGAGAQLLRRQLRELEWLHEHHPDTGLLNLAGLIEELAAMMRNATDGRKLILSIMQLDNFLEIQNTFGAAFGMHVLAQVVDRARHLVPPKSLLALVQPDRLVSVVRGEEASQPMREGIETAVTSRTSSTACRSTSRQASAWRIFQIMRQQPKSSCKKPALPCTGRPQASRTCRSTTPPTTAPAATT